MDGWFFSKHPNLWCRWAQSPPFSFKHAHTPAHTHTLYLWMGSLKGKKIKFTFHGLAFSNGAVVSKEGEGRGIIMSILMQNREVKGYYQLFIEGAKTSGDPWDCPVTCKSWKIPEREDACKKRSISSEQKVRKVNLNTENSMFLFNQLMKEPH